MNYSIIFTELSFSAETSFFGRDFVILTDHKPLLGLFSEDKISNMAPPRLVRRPEHQIGESAYPVSPTGNFGTFR